MTIVTPEGLSMEVTLAGIGSRGIALILDSIIQSVLLFAIILLMALFGDVFDAPGGSAAENVLAAVAIVLIFLVFFAYHAFFEASSGQTPGKRAAAIRVVDVGGGPIGFKAAAIRNVMRLVDFLPFFYGVAIISSIASGRNQRLGDMVAGTIVIHVPKASRRKQPVVHEHAPPHDPKAYETWDVSAVTQEELATVRMFLERRASLQPRPRYDLAEQLAGRLRSKVHGAHDEDAEVFLEKLAAAKAARG